MLLRLLFPLILLVAAVSGCTTFSSTKKTHFYSLETIQPETKLEIQQNYSLGIGPMNFPKLLDRPHIVTRTSKHVINRAEYQQWGGSFEDEFLQVLAENIELRSGSKHIVIYPWNNRFRPDYQLRINVLRFDGELGKQIVLNTRWQLSSQNGKNLITTQHSTLTMPTQNGQYDGYVAALSKTISVLAEEMVNQLNALIAQDQTKSLSE